MHRLVLPARSERLSRAILEVLESRRMLHTAIIVTPIPDQTADNSPAPITIDLADRYSSPDFPRVKFDTPRGEIVYELRPDLVPGIVENFLRYVDANRYDNTLIHRASSLSQVSPGVFGNTPTQVLQGGQLTFNDSEGLQSVPTFSPVSDEIVAGNNNAQYTLAMANAGPNTSTGQWFINVTDNSGSLGNNYNVFGQLLSGATAINQLAALQKVNVTSLGLGNLPVINYSGGAVEPSNLVLVDITRVPALIFSVDSDNAALVTPTINGNSLQLAVAAGLSGTANINVRIRLPDEGEIVDTFVLTVAPSVATNLTANLGVGGSQRVVYTEADGTITTLTLSEGTGSLNFDGEALAAITDGNVTTITGNNIVLSAIDITDADGGTLNIRTSGADRNVTIGSINSTSSLNRINAPSVTLSGSSTLGGAVRTIRLANAKQLAVNGDVRSLRLENSEDGITIVGMLANGNFGTIGGLDVNSAGDIEIETLNGNFFAAGAVDSAEIDSIVGNIILGSANNLDLGPLNGALTVTGDLRNAKLQAVAGDVTVLGASRSFRIVEGITGNVSIGQSTRLIRIETLRGNLNVSGAARAITIADAADAELNIGGAEVEGARVDLTVKNASDVNVTSAIHIRRLRTDAWATGDESMLIAAPSIGSLASKGSFAPELTLNNAFGAARTLSSASIKGEVGAGVWSITGNVGTLSANAINSGWSAVISGELRTLKVAGDLLSDLTAGRAGTITVNGSMTASTISLTEEPEDGSAVLRKLTVKGQMTDSVVRSHHGNIGTVSLGAMHSSKLLAGSVDENFADGLDDFDHDVRISRVTVKKGDGSIPTFSNSIIQSRRLGSINVGTINPGNDVAFGVAADDIASITGFNGDVRFPRLRNLDEPSESAADGTFGAFEIRVF